MQREKLLKIRTSGRDGYAKSTFRNSISPTTTSGVSPSKLYTSMGGWRSITQNILNAAAHAAANAARLGAAWPRDLRRCGRIGDKRGEWGGGREGGVYITP